MKNEKELTLHFVPHTHWDREWYLPFQEFRYHLVNLIDRLIPILESRKEYSNFVLDGQTIVLDDYLEIRPEMQERLLCLIPTGRLHVGPFYVLPDEFLVSGEALIRNLLIGVHHAQQFGRVMKIGYLPDPFGHIAQMPQILQGFGIDNFIFTRGMGDEADELGSEFIWQAPDGTEVLAINQLGGYCNGGGLGIPPQYWSESWEYPVDQDLIRARIKKILAQHRRRSSSQHVLVNNGCDHLMPQPNLPKIIRFLHQEFPELHFKITNFAEYLQAVKSEKLSLKHFSNELRGGRDHHLLPGVLSSRIYLKQANAELQVLLEKYAEPLTAIRWLQRQDKSPIVFLHHAWRLLLQNHPHDSICGCSIDPVHQEMMTRFTLSNQITRQIIFDCLSQLWQIKVNPIDKDQQISILVWNPHPWSVTCPIRKIVQLPLGLNPNRLILVDDAGNPVATENLFTYCVKEFGVPELAKSLFYEESEAELKTYRQLQPEWFLSAPCADKPSFVDLQFMANDLPPCGYRVFKLRQEQKGSAISSGSSLQLPSQIDEYRIENDWIVLQVNGNGSIDLTDKTTGKHFSQLNILEDQEDAGDEYDYSPAPESLRLTTGSVSTRRSWQKRTKVVASIAAEFNWKLPAGLQSSRRRRKQTLRGCQVKMIYSLTVNSPLVEVEVQFDNRVQDHRVRALIPTGLVSDSVYVDDAFRIAERPVAVTPHPKWLQKPQGTQPQQRFVAVSDQRQTLALCNTGLPEYEALSQKDEVVLALTLFRGVAWLSRSDLLTRRGEAGPSLYTPAAQCSGKLRFRYAMAPLAGSFAAGTVHRLAAEFQAPPLVRIQEGELKESGTSNGLVEILSPELAVSAIKKTETRDSLVLRVYNLTGKNQTGKMRFLIPWKEVWEIRLNESRIGQIQWQPGQELELNFRPYQIQSLELVPEQKVRSSRNLA